jgi:diguanylate cyclase (GGDEF)-like protein
MPPTILIADDDTDCREILRRLLEMSGFSVLEASDGQEALQLVRTAHPDLLLLDYTMPSMNGPKTCEVLKQDLLLRHLPVVMLTARSDLRNRIVGLNAGADDYIVKPFEPEELLARVHMILRRTAQGLEANPLSRLPGNTSIHKELESRLASGAPFAVCYADLDHFKAFNDHYGFERGDQAIQHTASLLLHCLSQYGNPTDFLGHIGGDDFVFVTTPERAENLCRHVISEFDRTTKALYDEADRARGHLIHLDRQGLPTRIGMLTISIAIVTNTKYKLTHIGEIAQVGAELKAYAKRFDHSIFVTDRRKATSVPPRTLDSLVKE